MAKAFGATSHAPILPPPTPSAPPCPPTSDVILHEMIALKATVAAYEKMAALKEVKKKLLDSEANISIVSSYHIYTLIHFQHISGLRSPPWCRLPTIPR